VSAFTRELKGGDLMIRTLTSPGLIATLVLTTVAAGTTRARPIAEADIELARAAVGSQLLLLNRVDVVFNSELPDGMHEARYVRDGDRQYVAHIVVGAGVVGMPVEAAWDGAAGAQRVGAGILFQIDNKARLVRPIGTLHEELLTVPSIGLGLATPGDGDGNWVLSSDESGRLTADEIELVFLNGRDRARVKFDRRHEYLPVSIETFDRNKAVKSKLTVGRFITGKVGDSTWIYPALISIEVPAVRPPATYRLSVKRDMVRYAFKQPDAQFQLEPFPNESVLRGSRNVREPIDKNWKPDPAELHFPWSAWFAHRIEQADGVADPDSLLMRHGASWPDEGSTDASSSTPKPGGPDSARPTRD
jgi:hypothetical protein